MRRVKRGQWYTEGKRTTCDLGMLKVILEWRGDGYDVGVAGGGYGRWLKKRFTDINEAKKAGLNLAKKIAQEIIKQAEESAQGDTSEG